MMRGMMDSASHSVLLADSTKFGRKQFAEVGGLNENTTLITEARPSQALLDHAAEVSARVIITSEEPSASSPDGSSGS
jgi:DeoR/GlpR family transcriptional regulator of sugar metabolism